MSLDVILPFPRPIAHLMNLARFEARREQPALPAVSVPDLLNSPRHRRVPDPATPGTVTPLPRGDETSQSRLVRL
jgi:hypothetical protein